VVAVEDSRDRTFEGILSKVEAVAASKDSRVSRVSKVVAPACLTV
jgi:hypothetical protein